MYCSDNKYKFYIIALVICFVAVFAALYYNFMTSLYVVFILIAITLFYIIRIANYNGYNQDSVFYLLVVLVVLGLLVILSCKSIMVMAIILLLFITIAVLFLLLDVDIREDLFICNLLVIGLSFILIGMSGYINTTSLIIALVYLIFSSYKSLVSDSYDSMLLAVPILVKIYVITETINSINV